MIDLERAAAETAARRVACCPALASLLGVAIDRERLTEALEAEALRRSDAIKTALLRAVSHDLRSPLMAILTSASASATPTCARARRIGTSCSTRSRSRRAGSTVWSPTCSSCPGCRPGAAQPSPALCRSTTSSYRRSRTSGDADRVVVSLGATSRPVRVDAVQIERVLANLIENALKYSPRRSPSGDGARNAHRRRSCG